MSVRFKLRNWLNLEHSAEYLSVSTGDKFSTYDVLDLIREDKLPVYWDLVKQRALQVVPFVRLHNLQINNIRIRSPAWLCIRDGKSTSERFLFESSRAISGRFRIAVEHRSPMKQVLVSALTGEDFQIGNVERFVVEDLRGDYWLLLENDLEAEQKAQYPREYNPYSKPPKLTQLTFKRSDLESLLEIDEPTSSHSNVPGFGSGMPPHWGEGLQVLVQAASKFWKNADPDNPETHPKSRDIEEWLRSQGISDRVCKSAPQLLRPYWAIKKLVPPKTQEPA